MAATRLSDVIVPAIFTPYVTQRTKEKTNLIQSGAMVDDAELSNLLGGGGLTFNSPSFKDLSNSSENVSTDDPTQFSTPNNIQAVTEIQVRLSRNNSWSSMDLVNALAGPDPMEAIGALVSNYWVRRLQQAFIATIQGNFAQNALASPVNAIQNDMTVNISGSSFVNGVTNFSAEAFIDATVTLGDSMGDVTLMAVHSVVYARMQKNNLIDFIPDARGEIMLPTFLGRRVIVDDSMPRSGGVYETWLFGAGAVRFGSNRPKVPTEVDRAPAAGNGGGQEILYDRHEWIIHPIGNAYVGVPPSGGPSNAATTNNLAAAASWNRVFPERKQIPIARLITREA